eukprot:Selendium_serpulae@DN7553_c0_g1_i1.p1
MVPRRKARKKASVAPSVEAPKHLALVVSILGARNIAKVDPNRSADAFVEFEYESEKYKTEVIKDSLCPNWNQKFELKFDAEKSGKSIKLKVYDHDEDEGDDIIGNSTIDLSTLKIGTAQIAWPELSGKRTEGHIGYKICVGDEVEIEQVSDEPAEKVEAPPPEPVAPAEDLLEELADRVAEEQQPHSDSNSPVQQIAPAADGEAFLVLTII